MESTKETDRIFEYFHAISRIPRCSGNEKAVSDYLVAFAESRGIEVFQDEYLNVVMKKPASEGYEDAPAVMLQGHMDMVCVKTEDSCHDFETEPLEIIEEEGFLKAVGTTLGADNGIAVALIMAFMAAENLRHPALEGVITTCEETGMDGALGLDGNKLKSKILVNLDSEEEGVFLASCAGGVNNLVRIPIRWEKPLAYEKAFRIRIRGLRGGHSGADIDKRRGNAIMLMGRLFESIEGQKFQVFDLRGGNKRNAIADASEVRISCPESGAEKLEKTLRHLESIFREEFGPAEPDLEILMEEIDLGIRVIEEKSLARLMNLLRLIPDGIQTMSARIPGLVESSTNVGVMRIEGNEILLSSAVRSSTKSLKEEINHRIGKLCRLLEAEMILDADYPEWTYRPDSPVRDIFMDAYEELFEKKAIVGAVHAGLECGFMGEKIPGIDMIALGPDMFDVHSPRERLDMASVERTWLLVKTALEKIR